MDHTDPKTCLRHYLQASRDSLIAKIDGLSEHDARLPRTPTGTNLAGILKHCANVEIVYFGPTFGREWAEVDDPNYVAPEIYDTDPQADWYLPAEASVASLIAFYRRVWVFAEPTLDLPLDTPGKVAHWDGEEVTLHQIMVHALTELDRHAGQADILREDIDRAVGLHGTGDNIPKGYDWPAYVAKLTAIAEAAHCESPRVSWRLGYLEPAVSGTGVSG